MLVIDAVGENIGILSRDEALRRAQELELDLVLVSPQANPPVAKIISWSKFKYEQGKKAKGNKSKSSEMKEMWFKPFIDEGDLDHKLKRVREFTEKGHKVKLTVRTRRANERTKAQETMAKLTGLVTEFAKLEGEMKREGHNLAIFVNPK